MMVLFWVVWILIYVGLLIDHVMNRGLKWCDWDLLWWFGVWILAGMVWWELGQMQIKAGCR